MATDIQQIETIRTQTLSLIQQITESPKPTYSINGQSVSWGQYLKQLQDTVTWCDSQMDSYSPGEVIMKGYT